MKTYLPPVKEIDRRWYLVDAEDRVLGRLATRLATILMGKDKAWYTDFLDTGDFLFDAPGLFEAVLIPQLYNARRFDYDLSGSPRTTRIEAACLTLPAFQRAHPDNQPDAPQ